MKLLVLIIGPESTATRAFTEAFSNHANILGTNNAKEHIDILDPVWFELEKNNINEAVKKFPTNNDKIIVTRRSIPHGIKPGEAAKYMTFPNIYMLYQLCKKIEYRLFILITTRSPIPNIISMAKNRRSTNGEVEKAFNQYQMAYKKIFEIINKYQIQYFIISVESFLLDQANLILSLHKYFGIALKDIKTDVKVNINKQHYIEFLNLK